MPPAMSRRLSEDELIARFFAPAAGPAALGLKDDAALSDAAGRLRPRADLRRAGGRSAFLRRRSARLDRPQGAAGEPLRSGRQGRAPAWFPAVARALVRLDRGLARRLRRRARGRRGRLRLPARRRRHGEDPGAAHPLDRRLRRGPLGPHGGAHRGSARRPALCHRHDWRCGDRPPGSARGGGRI